MVRISTNRKHNVSETDPVSETLCFLFVEIRTMDKVQKLNSTKSYRLSTSESCHCEDWYIVIGGKPPSSSAR
jgi:hypothetical protein